jgi:hypothetical protein
MERILALADFSNLAFRSHSRAGMSSYAMVRRVLLRTREVVRAIGATDLAFVFDPDPTPSIHWSGPAEEARVPAARAILRSLGYPCYQDGISADDLLIAAARRAEEAGFTRVAVISHDRDLLAAVSAQTSLIRPETQGHLDIWDAARITRRFGVPAAAFADLRVLGCRPFFGTTRAILDGKASRRLLHLYGSLENIYLHLAEIEPERLRDHLAADEAFARSRLAGIRAIEAASVLIDREGGHLGQPVAGPIDPGLWGLDRGGLLESSDEPRLALWGQRSPGVS